MKIPLLQLLETAGDRHWRKTEANGLKRRLFHKGWWNKYPNSGCTFETAKKVIRLIHFLCRTVGLEFFLLLHSFASIADDNEFRSAMGLTGRNSYGRFPSTHIADFKGFLSQLLK